MAAKHRVMLQRLHASPYYIQQETTVQAKVERWTDTISSTSTTAAGRAATSARRTTLEDCLAESKPGSHIPPELTGSKKSGRKGASNELELIANKLRTDKSKELNQLEDTERRSPLPGDLPDDDDLRKPGSDSENSDKEEVDEDEPDTAGEDDYENQGLRFEDDDAGNDEEDDRL